MALRSPLSRLERLEQLKGLLAARDHVTAGALASELGVGIRTVNRDLALLRETGVAIESDRGRGGGLRLHRRWSGGRVTFDYREAVDLLLSLAIAESLGSTILLRQLRAIRSKVAMTFSPPQRARIRLLRQRVLVGTRASAAVMTTYQAPPTSTAGALHEAFFEMKGVEILYVDAHGRQTTRHVEPHYLYLSWPIWYLLAWDTLREDVRSFRIDRIRAAKSDGTEFGLKDPRPFLAAVGGAGRTI